MGENSPGARRRTSRVPTAASRGLASRRLERSISMRDLKIRLTGHPSAGAAAVQQDVEHLGGAERVGESSPAVRLMIVARRQAAGLPWPPDGDGHRWDVRLHVCRSKTRDWGPSSRQGHGLGDGSFGSFARHSAALVGACQKRAHLDYAARHSQCLRVLATGASLQSGTLREEGTPPRRTAAVPYTSTARL